jgi:5'-nucleotidase
VDISKVAGIKICRQNRGYWQEEFDQRTDPAGKHYYWLTGVFRNSEPDATDTDEWALNNNFVSIVPLKTDLTSHDTMKELVNWNFNHE